MSGWGIDDDNSLTIPPSLKWAKVQPLDESTCIDTLEQLNPGAGLTIGDTIVCAPPKLQGNRPDPDGGRACFGDNGGPLVTKTDGDAGFSLVGIVSTSQCDSWFVSGILSPSLYTEVSQFMDWISEEASNLMNL